MAGYTHQAPFDTGHLPVGSIHKIFYAQYGQPNGKPVIFLHGGPGHETSIDNTAFFDPTIYRIILLDQRGCGQSLPHGDIRENTSQHLATDIDALRTHLHIPKWHMVFGGSWGSTLALLYAQEYPQHVGSLVLRGICTMRHWEIHVVHSPAGPGIYYPQEYRRFVEFLPEGERDDPLKAYHRRIISDDPKIHGPAAKEWNRWELGVSKVAVPPTDFEQLENAAWSLAHARMETQYFINGAFLEEGQLLKEGNVARIRHIPCTMVQGRLDLVCPATTAVELHEKMPHSQLHMIPAAGHSAKEPGIFKKLVEICDEHGRMDLT